MTKLESLKRVAIYPIEQPSIPYVLHIDGVGLDQKDAYVLCKSEKISTINNEWSEHFYPDQEPVFLWHVHNSAEVNCPDCLKHPFYTEYCIELDVSDDVDEFDAFNKIAKRFLKKK